MVMGIATLGYRFSGSIGITFPHLCLNVIYAHIYPRIPHILNHLAQLVQSMKQKYGSMQRSTNHIYNIVRLPICNNICAYAVKIDIRTMSSAHIYKYAPGITQDIVLLVSSTYETIYQASKVDQHQRI